MGLGYRPLPPRTASSIHRPSVSQTLAWRWGLAPRSQVRAERYCPHDSDCNRIVCFVGTNSLSALRWNSNGGYVASSLRQLCLILSVSNTTLYNKQNFVHQTTYWTLLPHVDLSGDFRPGQCWGRVRWLWTPTTRPLARPSPPNTTRCCSWPHGASWTWLGRCMTRKPLLVLLLKVLWLTWFLNFSTSEEAAFLRWHFPPSQFELSHELRQPPIL